MYEFKMPSLGAEMTHGTLLEWHIAPGDIVKLHDIIAVIDTDKAAVEVEAFGEGIVEKLITTPGELVPVGTVMALIRERGDKEVVSSTEPTKPVEKIKISPLARKLAHQLNIDISQMKGSGPDGVITEADIKKNATVGSLKEDHTQSMRKVIATAMARSKREIPHYYLSSEIDLNNALEWLEKYNKNHSVTERIVYAALLIKAVVRALNKFPEFNGYYINNEYKASELIHVGMAISLRGGGLITPALLHTEKLSLVEIMNNLTDLVTRTRTGKLKGRELSDSTITITNLGELGVDSVFGVIYPPQVALIGFGRITPKKTIIATLSADHRVSNGLVGSRFLSFIAKILQEPDQL
ncbi:TPA: 2-oxo acid dehydrogenase subunit E2 [Legionella pneumophila]|nr:dihydrolipoamide acetyltransferase family protein [Legionella pneumophila]HAT2067344.1 2-oxo acid dehydrogenase subunit E2 [Legionella pneumophila]HAT8593493.1 2-oxo acid dehydrogenase subunit E2 [Legionella pneumophila]HAU1577564.1 2-oxo acid dehydrogenase subunit E2 [Legionella pneumophila]HAU1681802.1 2-oxo acid dehydrogenase subunit E2 [Legionella pneumophila]HAU3701262.1 2-oxo acid dehydrogenase subunit E2 [Legionella pneumophila]